MAITKTKFINYSRCPRFFALEDISKDVLNKNVSYEEYKNEELSSMISELSYEMFEENTSSKQLDSMLPYYNQVEMEAAKIAKKYFCGNFKYAYSTKNQKSFSFRKNDLDYICYVDIYNETKDSFNIIEVKATTSNSFWNLKSGYRGKESYSIFKKVNNILFLKDDISGYNIEKEMPLDNYYKEKEKLFDRFKTGSYVFDLAVQRYFIENEYKNRGEEKKIKNVHYYLAVLNSNYVFPGKYENNNPIYEKNGSEELIIFIDLTTVTKKMMEEVEIINEKLLSYIENPKSDSCDLGDYCCYKKKNQCKYFDLICGKKIPSKNSSLCYINNSQGFKIGEKRIKGLELINNNYLTMLDIPKECLTNYNHLIQYDCVKNNEIYINAPKIKAAIDSIEYPIYHLDFETMPCPLPRFKGERPYTQSPFEFSLHIERKPNECDFDKDSFVYLAKDMNDNREELVKELLAHIDVNKGTLLAQNVSFEKGRIKELASSFPKYEKDLMKLYDRAFDLLWFLNNNKDLYQRLGFDEYNCCTINYYNEKLNGSYSIKKTLPIFSTLTYDNLIVKNGTEAVIEYTNYNKMSAEEFKEKYQALKDYCKQDTWAMVVILKSLRLLVK